jgi:TonB family protein
MKTLVCVTFAFLICVAHAIVQANPAAQGEIHGIVADPQTAPIAGATVTFTALETKRQLSVKTGPDGRYEAPLPLASYSVRVEAYNFETASIPEFHFGEAQSLTLDFSLEVAHGDPVEVVVPEVPMPLEPTPGISVIKFVAPVYPPIARTARVQGDVKVYLVVATDGTPQQVQVVSGHPMLKDAAMQAVRQWTFGLARPDREMNHEVVFRFRMLPGTIEEPAPAQPNEYIQPRLPSSVTIWAEPKIVGTLPDASEPCPKKRSPVCLYLWNCKRQRCYAL